MENKKIIVQINSSFARGKELLEWLKKFSIHSDDDFIYWDEFAFTTAALSECDALLILNNPSEKIATTCYPENVLAVMMEPGVYSEHPWMFKKLDQYSIVYSPIQHSSNTVLSHGYMGWYLTQDYHFFSALPVPVKAFDISCIASDLSMLSGHQLRLDFINTLRKQMPEIHFFGKGSNYIPDKTEGLLPYRYSIAIENTSAPYYFTEKINDCFLTYTVPLYYGCKNIGKYFPEKAFIQVNIEEPEKAIAKMRQAVERNDWQERIDALQEARQLVLNKYQPLAGAAAILRQTQPSYKRKILIKPVPDTLLRKIKNMLQDMGVKK
jgi:hypothetical protein